MILGVDIGGSHITVATIDTKNHDIPEANLLSTYVDSTASANEIINVWISALQKSIDSLNQKPLEGICIAIPGPFNYPNGIFAYKMEHKFASLFGLNIKEIIIRQLMLPKSIPLRFYNDAACFGIGESWKGKLKFSKKALAITLGTGFGATFLNNGVPMLSGNGVPQNGELYHIPFKNGIADEYFSTRWFIKKYKDLTDLTITGVKDLTQTRDNKFVAQVFSHFSKNLGCFLSPWLKEYNADAIVIGGNIAKAWDFFAEDLRNELDRHRCYTKIYQSDLKEKAILLGGARLANDAFYNSLSV
ncbi:ROK family protein [Aquimarina sediminis]|uniref:ROK family protein n=1 Tax=Aquimarina sediminis TaxID=2070536 RepID=UPI000CA01E7F|nr:ROK family protein [Aquimarina sediminis]